MGSVRRVARTAVGNVGVCQWEVGKRQRLGEPDIISRIDSRGDVPASAALQRFSIDSDGYTHTPSGPETTAAATAPGVHPFAGAAAAAAARGASQRRLPPRAREPPKMGSFLDKPQTQKEVHAEENATLGLKAGLAAMQGWRVDMEVRPG